MVLVFSIQLLASMQVSGKLMFQELYNLLILIQMNLLILIQVVPIFITLILTTTKIVNMFRM